MVPPEVPDAPPPPSRLGLIGLGTVWGALGGALTGVIYGLFVGCLLGVQRSAPDLLLLQLYTGAAGAVVGALLLVPMLGLAAARGALTERREAHWLAMGGTGYLLALQLAASVIAEPEPLRLAVFVGLAVSLTAGTTWVLQRLSRTRGTRRSMALIGGSVGALSLVVQLFGSLTPTAARAATPPPAARPTTAARAPVLWYSLDGATWRVMQPLIEAGELPTIARLTREGAWGVLRSEPPGNSSTLNTTLATGRPPAEHGITRMLEFQLPGIDPIPAIEDEHDYGGPLDTFYMLCMLGLASGTAEAIPPVSGSRRTPAIWNLLDSVGLRTAVVGWFCTWPAERLEHGRVVSDRFGHSEFSMFFTPRDDLPERTHPDGLLAELAPLVVQPDQVPPGLQALADWTPEDLAALKVPELGFVGINTRALLKFSFNHDQTKLAVLHRLLDQGPQPDLAMIHLTSADVAEHIFWAHRFPDDVGERPSEEELRRYGDALDNVYRELDRQLARLLARMDPRTIVLITSDHGMTSKKHTLGWGKHDLDAVYCVAGPGVAKAEAPLSLYEIAPLLLHLSGLEKPAEMPGRVPTEILSASKE